MSYSYRGGVKNHMLHIQGRIPILRGLRQMRSAGPPNPLTHIHITMTISPHIYVTMATMGSMAIQLSLVALRDYSSLCWLVCLSEITSFCMAFSVLFKHVSLFPSFPLFFSFSFSLFSFFFLLFLLSGLYHRHRCMGRDVRDVSRRPWHRS